MNNDLKNPPAACGDFAELEKRVLALEPAPALTASIDTGRAVSDALVVVGAAFGSATAEFARIRESLRRLAEDTEVLILFGGRRGGIVAESYARAPNGILTAQELSDAMQRAGVFEADVKTIAVEYHAPAAPGRRKVGGAQWKNERRGGFSRR